MRNDTDKYRETKRGTDANRDPISGAPGAHPVGTGVGATGGGLAGAAIGAAAGPIGAAVALAAGAVAGGLAGKAVAEQIDPTVEDAYWREHYRTRPYVEAHAPYETYAPAYRLGYEGRGRYAGRSFEDAEMDLQRDYDTYRADSNLEWERAKLAARDAWHRVERAIPGDADRDGR